MSGISKNVAKKVPKELKPKEWVSVVRVGFQQQIVTFLLWAYGGLLVATVSLIYLQGFQANSRDSTRTSPTLLNPRRLFHGPSVITASVIETPTIPMHLQQKIRRSRTSEKNDADQQRIAKILQNCQSTFQKSHSTLEMSSVLCFNRNVPLMKLGSGFGLRSC